MAEATTAPAKPGGGRATLAAGAVGERVARLRQQAAQDPEGARVQAWSWIKELGRRATSEREEALSELQQMFLCGEPAEGIRGQTEGVLVTWTMNPSADKLFGALTNSWMPWLGKKFYPEENRGENTLTKSAVVPSKLLWPLYSTSDSPLGRTAFDFTTNVEAGELDPSVDVLVIDYGSVSSNPRLLIRQIRDELVQIVPGANLGKMLVRVPRRQEPFPALYFALRSELG
ncbi:MAG: hypothetical protein M3Z27_08200 [Actinomycetota bacterium]|nr:hypothetical protein [Actinomycetota bacterium]